MIHFTEVTVATKMLHFLPARPQFILLCSFYYRATTISPILVSLPLMLQKLRTYLSPDHFPQDLALSLFHSYILN